MTSMVTSCTLLSRAAPTAKLPRGALQSCKPAAVALQRKPRPLSVRCAAAAAVHEFDIAPFGESMSASLFRQPAGASKGSYICVQPRPWSQAAVLPFSTTPNKYRRRPSALCASINISPDALVHPSREVKKQQGITGGEGTKQWGIEDAADSVKLWFVVTGIVKNDVKVALHQDDVLVISEEKTTNKEYGDRGALDVRLLMTPGYDKNPEWRWVEENGGKVTLEVIIQKRRVHSKPISVS